MINPLSERGLLLFVKVRRREGGAEGRGRSHYSIHKPPTPSLLLPLQEVCVPNCGQSGHCDRDKPTVGAPLFSRLFLSVS